MSTSTLIIRALALFAVLSASGCVTRPPTIAHVHVGHALTGVHVTPGQAGYLLVAEERAVAVRDLATVSDDSFGLRHSIVQASNHITFAATSDDASANIRASAPQFARDIVRVVERCELIGLLGKDVAATTSVQEGQTLAAEIAKLAQQNIDGEDADGDGLVGGKPAEYGMKQLRTRLSEMIAREDPPYRTVDQTYLFNLVRLPNGKWVFDKFKRGGNIEGYK
jgi:hypothetical protein